jgi:hypothetical protein
MGDVRIAKAPRKEPTLYPVRLHIAGLQQVMHEDGWFELMVADQAELPDCTDFVESLVAGGFDRNVAEAAFEKFVGDLRRRQWAMVLAERINAEGIQR